MMTRTRAGLRRQGYLVAGLALAALSSGPLMAGPFGGQGYATSNGYAPSNGMAVGAPAYNGYAPGAAGCATCATPIAVSGHPGHRVDCPPKFYHVFEGPPHLKFKKGCPRPICDPCELPHFGYFQTCWSPWPYPPDWRHCPYPTASDMLPAPEVPPFTPKQNAERYPGYDQPSKAPPGKPPVDDDDDDLPPGKKPPAPKPRPEELPTPKLEKKDKVHHVVPSSRPNVRLVGGQ